MSNRLWTAVASAIESASGKKAIVRHEFTLANFVLPCDVAQNPKTPRLRHDFSSGSLYRFAHDFALDNL